MAPLRRQSMASVSRSNQIQSRASAGTAPLRQQPRLNQGIGRSDYGNQNLSDLEPDFDNERLIQCKFSIEELLPEKERNAIKSDTPQLSTSQRSISTREIPVKAERVSEFPDDVYDVSPRRYVYKGADVGRSRTSRSTAQLTTPGASPMQKFSRRSVSASTPITKAESHDENDGRNGIFAIGFSSPRLSTEKSIILKTPLDTNLPTTLHYSDSNGFQILSQDKSRRGSSIDADKQFDNTIFPPRSLLERYNGIQIGHLCGTSKLEEIGEKSGIDEDASQKLSTKYPPILPPPRARSPVSKTMTCTRTIGNISAINLASEKSVPTEGSIHIGKKCCKLSCLQLTAADLSGKGGLGPPEESPQPPRLKSLSTCPSSVSSFGSEDGIPPSGKMYREAGRTIRENTKILAANLMSEASPSLRHSNLQARFEIHDKDKINIYEDFDEDTLSQNDSHREIFGKSREITRDHVRKSIDLTHQRSLSVGGGNQKMTKKLQQISRRSLRSFSATNDLSKKSETLDQGTDPTDGSETELVCCSVLNEDCVSAGNRSGHRDERRTSEERSAQASFKLSDNGLSIKRPREVIDNWDASFSNDEDMIDEDVVEIDQDMFERSENRRKKRHKNKPVKPGRDSKSVTAVPKEEPVDEVGDIFPVGNDSTSIDVIYEGNEGSVERAVPCAYYMNTYWEHGRASDGRKARDGFISYTDLKEYCRKNNQPTDDRCTLTYKKDLKHHLKCEYHANLRPDLYRVAWNFEHNPGFSFKSTSRDEETRRIQNEAIGNAPSPSSSSRASQAVADSQDAEMIMALMKVIGSSHTADVAQLVKSKRKVENEVRGLKRYIAKMRKR